MTGMGRERDRQALVGKIFGTGCPWQDQEPGYDAGPLSSFVASIKDERSGPNLLSNHIPYNHRHRKTPC